MPRYTFGEVILGALANEEKLRLEKQRLREEADYRSKTLAQDEKRIDLAERAQGESERRTESALDTDKAQRTMLGQQKLIADENILRLQDENKITSLRQHIVPELRQHFSAEQLNEVMPGWKAAEKLGQIKAVKEFKSLEAQQEYYRFKLEDETSLSKTRAAILQRGIDEEDATKLYEKELGEKTFKPMSEALEFRAPLPAAAHKGSLFGLEKYFEKPVVNDLSVSESATDAKLLAETLSEGVRTFKSTAGIEAGKSKLASRVNQLSAFFSDSKHQRQFPAAFADYKRALSLIQDINRYDVGYQTLISDPARAKRYGTVLGEGEGQFELQQRLQDSGLGN